MFIIYFTDGSTYECKTFKYGLFTSECDGVPVSTSKIMDVEEVQNGREIH